MPILIEAEYRLTREKDFFDPGNLNLKVRDEIIVKTDDGLECAKVIREESVMEIKNKNKKIHNVLRRVTENDRIRMKEVDGKSRDAYKTVARKIKEKNLNMKLSRVEYIYDMAKLYVYYTADGRVDFRELIKELGHALKTRIQMM